MESNRKDAAKKTGFNRSAGPIVILLNVVLLSCALVLFTRYTSVYQQGLREENLGNIANLNQSAAANATALISSWNIKLNDTARLAELRHMTRTQALDLLSDANSSPDRHFELISGDYTGYLAERGEDGAYPALDYSSTSYAPLHNVFDDIGDTAYNDIRFAPEFTDSATALKYFAIYRHLSLYNDEGVRETYTLLLATRAKDVLAVFNSMGDYEGQSTVLIDPDGNYIVSNSDFKSANFFQYLYVYNDLSLDERNAVAAEMAQNGSGELYYKNASAVVEDCVYRYERMSSNGWYCVTCVPLSSFRTPEQNFSYIVYALLMLVTLFIVDMTWLQNMNRRLRVSMLREKEASAAKGNFMSRMSHEIRTPLNAVIGYNIIARSELSDAKSDVQRRQAEVKVMDCLTKSDVASRHLLTIINDVLDMSAIESGKITVARERFDFKSLISSLATIFYSQAAAKNVAFEIVFDTMTEEWFIGDQMRTNQVLTNLLSNAVKFTPEGGSVKLTIYQSECDKTAARIHFEIADNGIGMTEEYQTHIWTPFEQADSSISRRFGGTGLGLSITKNLVDLMGGSISLESKPGQGTTFFVDLTFGRTEQPQSGGTYDFSGVNALVIDDDRSSCDYVTLLFERCGAHCTAVTSGEDAIRAIAAANEAGERFTLCLVDWRMPDMDGLETVKRIRPLAGEDVPIMVLTAYDYSEFSDKAGELGVSRFLSKPLFQSSLLDLLATISGAGAPEMMPKAESPDFTGARILLAEDNKMNMEIARRIMESAGLTVDSAWNGEEAVELFTRSAPGFYAAILMDVHMPKMDGHEATRAIRASTHSEAHTVPIIAMTADAFAENVAEALSAGMNDHISKPVDVDTLFTVLAKYMHPGKAQ